ncbi:MAG: hypothetical protein M5U34_07905 [Chloroflexi bacterium]|nr:hypothetical protein [Chloroflexota bacterium]
MMKTPTIKGEKFILGKHFPANQGQDDIHQLLDMLWQTGARPFSFQPNWCAAS